MPKGLRPIWWQVIFREKTLVTLCITIIVCLLLRQFWAIEPIMHPWMLLPIFIVVFAAILMGAFAVVRHAGSVAISLREPLGTVILTLSVITIEVLMITSVMLTGDNNPVLARDTMYAIIMLVLNGLIGVTILLGAWRYKEQQLNVQGARAFLSVIFLMAVIGLILPNYTKSTSGPTLSPFLTVFLIGASLSIYGIFLGIQTVRHRKYFLEVNRDKIHDERYSKTQYSLLGHLLFLIIYLLLLSFLTKIIAVPIDYALSNLHAHDSFGGVVVAALILAPEAVAAVRASWFNQLQHSVNILLGSVLATISLTVPAVLIVAMLVGKTVVLGLDSTDSVMLLLTLIMSMVTFGGERTNVLQGVVHLLIFLAFIALIFD